MMKFWVNYKAFRKGGDGKLQKCIGMVAVFALLIEFGGSCFWSLNGWEMQYRKPVFADSWPTPSAFPEAATDTCYPKADQPGFGVGAMQANCGVVGIDDGLAFWTNARCAGQEYVQHRYCTVFKQDSGDCLFNKLDQNKVMELFEQVHFPTASCPGLGGVTGTEKSAINWGTSYNPQWCEHDQSHGCAPSGQSPCPSRPQPLGCRSLTALPRPLLLSVSSGGIPREASAPQINAGAAGGASAPCNNLSTHGLRSPRPGTLSS